MCGGVCARRLCETRAWLRGQEESLPSEQLFYHSLACGTTTVVIDRRASAMLEKVLVWRLKVYIVELNNSDVCQEFLVSSWVAACCLRSCQCDGQQGAPGANPRKPPSPGSAGARWPGWPRELRGVLQGSSFTPMYLATKSIDMDSPACSQLGAAVKHVPRLRGHVECGAAHPEAESAAPRTRDPEGQID